MYTVKARKDGFRMLLPDEFIPKEINEKYTRILTEAHSFVTKPIDFLNESIQSVEVLGFNNATIAQQMPRHGEPTIYNSRTEQNDFLHGMSDTYWRSPANPESIIDKTVNIKFRHTLGYLNYFILFESFYYMYSRDMKYKDMPKQIAIDLINYKGVITSRILLKDPLIDGIDMLGFDYTQPIANSETFQVVIKYSDFDYEFIPSDPNTEELYENEYNIIFKDWDGTIISAMKYIDGESVIAPKNPTRDGYAFIDWDHNVIPIACSDEVYIATYQAKE